MQQAPGVTETVRSVVAQQLAVSPESLTGDLPLDDLGLDDRTALLVLRAVEDRLDVRFPDDFYDGVQTFGQLEQAVKVAVRG